MASEKVVHVSDSDFDTRIIGSKQVCLVDFWAEWCGPCRSIGPVIDELAAEYEGKAVIAKVNVGYHASIDIGSSSIYECGEVLPVLY